MLLLHEPTALSSATLPFPAASRRRTCRNQFPLCRWGQPPCKRYRRRNNKYLVHVRLQQHLLQAYVRRCRDGVAVMLLQIQSSACGITYARPITSFSRHAQRLAVHAACNIPRWVRARPSCDRSNDRWAAGWRFPAWNPACQFRPCLHLDTAKTLSDSLFGPPLSYEQASHAGVAFRCSQRCRGHAIQMPYSLHGPCNPSRYGKLTSRRRTPVKTLWEIASSNTTRHGGVEG